MAADSAAFRYLLVGVLCLGDVAMIDTALLSAIAALMGSLIGGVATLTVWAIPDDMMTVKCPDSKRQMLKRCFGQEFTK